jgi:hypothetical protein
MFSRRVVTFLLGVWIGCCLLMDAVSLRGQGVSARLIENPPPSSKVVFTQAGEQNVAVLLRHQAAEQVRANLTNWEVAQLLIALLMLVLLGFTDQRKLGAIALAALMTVLAAVQHFGVTPEFTFLGRQADFQAVGAAAQLWTVTQIYAGLEIMKLLVGGVLASYLFNIESVVKRTRTRTRREEESAIASSH